MALRDEAGPGPEPDEKFCQIPSCTASFLEAASSGSMSTATKAPSPPDQDLDDAVIHEAWLLRRSYPLRQKTRSLFFLGICFFYSYRRNAVEWWNKALPTCSNDITTYLATSFSQNRNVATIHKKIVAMPQDAQWEIQELLEERENACNHRHVKRKWEIVGLVERPRRFVEGPIVERRWCGARVKKVMPLEWVLVIRGSTVDHEKRIVPSESGDSWEQRRGIGDDVKDPPFVCLQSCWHCGNA